MGVILIAIAAAGVLFVVTIAAIIIGPYIVALINARASGVPITLYQLIGMRLRRLNPSEICESLVKMGQAGIQVDSHQLEAHLLAGGTLRPVVNAVIAADRAELGYDFGRIAALDLAGRDVAAAVQMSVEPKVLKCPVSSSEKLSGVARDGIRLSVTCTVTVRANLERLVGGAGEATVIARVGEGIIAAIGCADSHKTILERPELITERVLSRGLATGTAYEIVSVDVMDVEVEDNVGARLAEEQAVADQRVAEARAEMRRSAAVAREQEMQARIVEMQGQVTLNQATVPNALSTALRQGRVWLNPNAVTPVLGRRPWDASEMMV